MAVIKTVMPYFTGYRASLYFNNGVAETNDIHLIEWFRSHGYIVEVGQEAYAKEPILDLQELSIDALRVIAKENKVSVGNTKSRDKLIAKIKEVM